MTAIDIVWRSSPAPAAGSAKSSPGCWLQRGYDLGDRRARRAPRSIASPTSARAARRRGSCRSTGDITDPRCARGSWTPRASSAAWTCSSTTRRSSAASGRLLDFDVPRFGRIFPVNVGAPIALIQLAVPLLAERRGLIVNITSDAAQGAYPGWGPYGASKAALELLTRTLAAELRDRGVSAVIVDPGDMRTRMHQEAFPREDISDRPLPEVTVAVLALAVRSESGHRPRRAIRRTAGGCAMAATGVTDFTLPANLEAAEPPEARGLRRDEVRLLVSDVETDSIEHARFGDLPRWLSAGRPARRQHERHAERRALGHDSGRRAVRAAPVDAAARRILERRDAGARSQAASLPYRHAPRGHDVSICRPAGSATLLAPYPFAGSLESPSRLWIAALELPDARPGVSRPLRLSDSIQLRETTVAGRDVPDRVRDRARQRRDAVGRPAVHAGAGHRLVSPAFRSRRSCCTRASPASKATNRRTRSSTASRARPPSASTPPDAPGIASSPSERPWFARSRP